MRKEEIKVTKRKESKCVNPGWVGGDLWTLLDTYIFILSFY